MKTEPIPGRVIRGDPGMTAELLLELDRTAGGLADQVVIALRDAIRSGRLAVGATVPPSRVLATDLAVSRGVVVEAYQQLVAEGYLVTRPGSGTRVAAGNGVLERADDVPETQAPARSAGPARSPRPPTAAELDLRPGTPDLSAFPRSAWLAALRQTLASAPHSVLGYVDPGGLPGFREEIAAYVGRVRAVVADPAHTVAISGVAHGLALGLRALADRGHRVLAVEDPSTDRTQHLLSASGLEIVSVPVDGEGLVVSALERTDATIVLATPAHQFPLGAVLAPQRRAALLQWARRVDGYVLEDDYDAEFRYDREPIGALQGLAPDRVLYLGTVSKSLAPGLRLGWAVAPTWLATAMTELRQAQDLGSPVLDQLTLAQLITSGSYDRHLRIMRRHYRHRRDALVQALTSVCPRWQLRGIAAGLHVVAELPGGTSETDVVQTAAEHGVLVQPLAPMRYSDGPPALVIGYSGLTPPRIAEAVGRLRSVATQACLNLPVGAG